VVHKVPREGGWYIDGLAKQSTDLMKPGCYVFACRSPGGSLPIYVGQAAKNIFDEAFNDRNVKNVNNYLSHRLRGKIEIYIIHQSKVHGDTGNKTCIDDIEDFLIGWASRRNAELLNIHGNRPDKWSIVGVANHANSGHPGSSVLAFKAMMGMKMKKAKTEPKLDAAEEITPEEVESVTPTTDIEDPADAGGADAPQAPTQL